MYATPRRRGLSSVAPKPISLASALLHYDHFSPLSQPLPTGERIYRAELQRTPVEPRRIFCFLWHRDECQRQQNWQERKGGGRGLLLLVCAAGVPARLLGLGEASVYDRMAQGGRLRCNLSLPSILARSIL